MSAYRWWSRDAGMLTTVSVFCACGEILSFDGSSRSEVAKEAKRQGWAIRAVWMCPECKPVTTTGEKA